MELARFFDLIVHAEQSLHLIIAEYGTLTYAVLLMIVFAETGLLIFLFLPGNALLFIAGAFCAAGALNIWAVITLLILAAISGNTVNYWIGMAAGRTLLAQDDGRWLNQAALQRARAFHDMHGGLTIVIGRFIPVMRTFAPFVAGLSGMDFARFQLYNCAGAVLWVVSLTAGGYFFGHIPFVRDHLNTLMLVGVVLVLLALLFAGLWKFCRSLSARRAR